MLHTQTRAQYLVRKLGVGEHGLRVVFGVFGAVEEDVLRRVGPVLQVFVPLPRARRSTVAWAVHRDPGRDLKRRGVIGLPHLHRNT